MEQTDTFAKTEVSLMKKLTKQSLSKPHASGLFYWGSLPKFSETTIEIWWWFN